MKKLLALLTILFLLLPTIALGDDLIDWQNDPLDWFYEGNGTIRALQQRKNVVSLPVTLVFAQPDGAEITLEITPHVVDLEYEFYIYRDAATGMYTGFAQTDSTGIPKITLIDGIFDYEITTFAEEKPYNWSFTGTRDGYDLIMGDKELQLTYNCVIRITANGEIADVEKTTVTIPLGLEEKNAVTKVGP